MKLGVFGGTFDPIHVGHLTGAEEARARLHLDEVLFVPAGQPWFKAGGEVSPARHRLSMVKLGVEGNPYFRASGVEVRRPGPSYSADTLEELSGALGRGPELYLIAGLDALSEIDRWERPERVLELSTVVGLARPGSEELDRRPLESVRRGAADGVVVIGGPLIGIGATEIRRRVSRGLSIRYLVPAPVETYIREHGLYAAPTGADGR